MVGPRTAGDVGGIRRTDGVVVIVRECAGVDLAIPVDFGPLEVERRASTVPASRVLASLPSP